MIQQMRVYRFLILVTIGVMSQSCVFIPPPVNKYKGLEGEVIKITEPSSLYFNDPTISHTREEYVIKGHNQFGDMYSLYLPAGSRMYIDKTKHIRSMTTDTWVLVGRVYINGKEYKCAFGMHSSYMERLKHAEWIPPQ